MKKAKLMLSALGVCALLATAFAFKAQSFSNHKVFFNDGLGGTGCTVPLDGKIITAAGGTQRASTTVVPANCPFAVTDDIPNE